MKIKQVGENKYKKLSWHEEHEMLAYTILAIIFWTVVLTAYFI